MQVLIGDALRHDDPVRVRTLEEVELATLLTALAAGAAPAGRTVGGDHTPAVEDAAELMPERRRGLDREQRVAAAERLQIGPVGERELDLDEQIVVGGPGERHLLDPQVAGAVEPRGLHGVKATLSAAPER